LFPVFGQARERARRTSALSNAKQISLGFQQYLQDYDERFMPYVTERQATSTRFGIATPTQAQAAQFSYRSLLQPYIKSHQVFKDPSAPEWPAEATGQWFSTDFGAHLNEANYESGFGQATWYKDTSATGGADFGFNENVTLAGIAKTSEFIVIANSARGDSGNASRGGLYPMGAAFPGSGLVDVATQARPWDKWHQGGAIFGYSDGHAKWQKLTNTWKDVNNNQWRRNPTS
ncbi:MAG TPA: hypothetical protein VF719_05980, partial [Abditibacteriaceae bacterium]